MGRNPRKPGRKWLVCLALLDLMPSSQLRATPAIADLLANRQARPASAQHYTSAMQEFSAVWRAAAVGSPTVTHAPPPAAASAASASSTTAAAPPPPPAAATSRPKGKAPQHATNASPVPYIKMLPLDSITAEEQPPTQAGSSTATPAHSATPPAARRPLRPASPGNRRHPSRAAPPPAMQPSVIPTGVSPPASTGAAAPPDILKVPPPTPRPAQAQTPHPWPLARRIAPHPIPPPDLALIAALTGWPGAAGGLLALAIAAMLWRRLRRPLPRPLATTPTALPAPQASIDMGPPPAEPRPPRRVDCREAEAEATLEPIPGRSPTQAVAAPTAGTREKGGKAGHDPAAEPEAEPSSELAAEPLATAILARGRNRAAKSRADRSGANALKAKPPRPLDETLTLAFEPLRFSATLALAVLPYRISITNGGATALGPVTIAGDMIAAEPAILTGGLTEQDAAHLPLLHTLPQLAPGANAELRGDLRVALGDIAPLRVGAAALMVPLVRLKLEAASGKQTGRKPAFLCRLAQFVVGEPDEAGAERLHPFRLALGPRSWSAAALGGLDLVA